MYRVWYTDNGERKYKRAMTLEHARNLKVLLERSVRNFVDIVIEEVDDEECEVTQAPALFLLRRRMLGELELLCRKVRGEDVYKLFIKDINTEDFKQSEIVVLEYIKETYGMFRGTKEEVEQKIVEIKEKIETLYTNPVETDLERLVDEVIEDAGLTSTRKKALVQLQERVAKLPYFNDLIGVIADELLWRKWFACVFVERR